MKRFLLASVIGLTLTASAQAALADEPAAADKPAAAAAPAAETKPAAPPVATTAAAPVAPPPAATHAAAAPAAAPAPPPATPAKPAVVAAVAAAPAPAPAPEPMAAAPAAAPSAAPSGTPLHIAQTTSAATPVQLAPPSEGLGWGYKLLALLAIGGGVALYLKKKKGFTLPGDVVPSKIEILGKSSVGVRSQLVVIEVDGTRLLVGMTPTSMNTLAVLQTPDDDVQPSSSRTPATSSLMTAGALASLTERADRAEQDAFRPTNLGERVRSLLGSDEPSGPRLAAVKAAPKPRPRQSRPASPSRPKAIDVRGSSPGMSDSREVAGQARGLLLSDDEDS